MWHVLVSWKWFECAEKMVLFEAQSVCVSIIRKIAISCWCHITEYYTLIIKKILHIISLRSDGCDLVLFKLLIKTKCDIGIDL